MVVIGGGLAGIAAALQCAGAGASVTLVEVRRRLGGAAYSFEREGLRLDNGQHVFLRCCTAYRALLERLGSEPLVSLQRRLEIPVLRPGAKRAVLRRGRLPAPLHLARALARYPHLTLAERSSAARAALALARLDPSEPALDRLTFGEWLAEHGQGPAAIGALWDLIALPTLNLPAAQASLALAAFVFRTGLLASASAGDIGFHAAPLGQTIDEPARRALERAGVEVKLGWRAQSPEGFLFAVKGSRFLTHMKKLKDPQEPVQRLLDRATGLEEKLGPILFQFPHTWHANVPRLSAFFHALRPYLPNHRFAFEFRHPSWLTGEVYSLLERHGCALCLPIHPRMPCAPPNWPTSPKITPSA